MLDVALTYASLGFRVLPCYGIYRWPNGFACNCSRGTECSHPGKHPAIADGVLGASRSPDVIQGWWNTGEMFPGCNLALVMGDGLIAIDVDVHGTDGPESWQRFCLTHSFPAGQSMVQFTPSGGVHYLLRTDERVGNVQGLLPGVDVKGEKGYILASPSFHIAGGPYRWQNDVLDTDRILDAPPYLIDMIKSGVSVDGTPTGGDAGGIGGMLPETEWIIENGLREGSRDTDCYRLACRLWAKYGQDGWESVVTDIYKAWERRAPGEPDFTWDDATDKIRYAQNFVRRSQEELKNLWNATVAEINRA